MPLDEPTVSPASPMHAESDARSARMARWTRWSVKRYGTAVVLASAGVGIRALIDPWLGDLFPLAPLFGAVALAHWFGGVGPAVLASALGYLACDWLFIPPRGAIVWDTGVALGVAVYFTSCALIIGLGEMTRAARERAEASGVALQQEAARRREAESRTVRALESMSDAFIEVAPDWRVVYMNAESARQAGRTRDEALGRTFWEAWLETAGTVVESECRRAMAERVNTRFDYFHAPRDRWYEVRAEPAEGAGLIIVARDISERKSTEERLRTKRERLQLVADAVPALISYIDAAGRYQLNNRSYGEWFGQPNVVGKHMSEVLGDAAWAAIRPHLESALTGRVVSYESRVRYSSGGTRWIHATYTPDVVDGQVRGVVAHVVDVTGRRRAEEALQVLARAGNELAEVRDVASTLQRVARVTLPVFADGCIVDMIGDDNRIERVALAHADPAREPFLRELQRRYPPTWDSPSPMVSVMRGGGADFRPQIPGLAREVARDAEHLRLIEAFDARSLIVVPLATGGRTFGAMAFVRNGASPSFDESDFELAQELGRRAAVAVENARLFAAIKAAERRKDEFIATLAHELRNPLAPIRNAVQIFRAKDPHDPDLRWSREVIERQVGQMARLLEDLLDVSRISRGKLDLRKERIELASVVRGALETSRPLIDVGAHELTIALPAEPVHLDADPVRVTQVFSNLLNNAAKYTDRGGRITLAAEVVGDAVQISVKDTGIGIAPELLPRVFEVFSQAVPALERSQGGLGIGLSLVKGLVEMHGGTVTAASDGPAKGTEFVVRLPIVRETAHPPAAALAPTGATPRRRIVVADDNADSAETLAMMLTLMGHEVRAAGDGVEAVEAAAAFAPEVVLLDIGMPRMNGLEAARQIRQQPWGRRTFIVALTGWGQEEDKRRSQEAGFDAHMVKPVDPLALKQLLATFDRRLDETPVAAVEPPAGDR